MVSESHDEGKVIGNGHSHVLTLDRPTHRHAVPTNNEERAELMRLLLESYGTDTSSEGSLETPMRWVKMMHEFFAMKDADLKSILKAGFEDPNGKVESGGIVMQQHIHFRGMCEHHLCPMWGEAAIGYIPNKRIVGLSKLARITDAAGIRRPSTQEEITKAIVDTLVDGLDPKGVIVITKAFHSCMACRGVNMPGVPTTVSHVHGVFRDNAVARSEFLMLLDK